MNARSGVRRMLCLLAAAGTMTLELLAAPIVTGGDAGVHHASHAAGTPAEDGWRPDKSRIEGDRSSQSPVPKLDEIRLDKSASGRPAGKGPSPERVPGAASALVGSTDDALDQRNSLLTTLMRDYSTSRADPLGLPGYAPAGLHRAGPGQALSWDSFENTLRMVRESILDESDTANFTLAGIELSLTLRGERRSLTLNGYEVLAASMSMHGEEPWRGPVYAQGANSPGMPGGTAERPVVQRDYHHATDRVSILGKIREFITEPLTLAIAFVTLGILVFLRIFQSARDQQSW